MDEQWGNSRKEQRGDDMSLVDGGGPLDLTGGDSTGSLGDSRTRKRTHKKRKRERKRRNNLEN